MQIRQITWQYREKQKLSFSGWYIEPGLPYYKKWHHWMFKSIYTLNDFNVISWFPYKLLYFNQCSPRQSLILRLGDLWINQKHVFFKTSQRFWQELHASPHIEHTPILSYPYVSIYGMSYPYMDMWPTMKFWPNKGIPNMDIQLMHLHTVISSPSDMKVACEQAPGSVGFRAR